MDHAVKKARGVEPVCLICLRRSGTSEVENETGYAYQVRVLDASQGLIPVRTGVGDIYIRFMRFVGRYMRLSTTTERLLSNLETTRIYSETDAKNIVTSPGCDKNGAGNNVQKRVQSFCKKCLEIVRYACDVFMELEVVKLHFAWKLEEIGKIMKNSKKGVSTKVSRTLEKHLSEQLQSPSLRQVEIFRNVLRLKCESKSKSIAPKVRIVRGLFPDEWKFAYSFVKDMLIRLIVVFVLASPTLSSKPSKNAIQQTPSRSEVIEENCKKIKKEKNHSANENCFDECDSVQDAGGTESESDWSGGINSPESDVSAAGNDDAEYIPPSGSAFPHKRCLRRRIKDEASFIEQNKDENGEGHEVAKMSKLECTDCNKVFRYKTAFARHLKVMHKYLLCLSCGTKFHSSHELQEHTKMVHGGKEHNSGTTCKFCETTFLSQRSLAAHLKDIHNSHIERVCKDCGAIFKTVKALTLHAKRIHPRKYKQKDSILKKIRDKKVKTCTTRPKGCPICSYASKSSAGEFALETHVKAHNKGFSCWHCDKLCYSEVALAEHCKLAHPSISVFYCRTCKKEYTSLRPFRDHLHSHETSNTQYFCGFCDQRFSNQQNYEIHMYIHISMGSKIYCDEAKCSRYFNTLEELRTHLSQHCTIAEMKQEGSPSENTQATPKIFMCSVCNWSFLNQHNLALHKLVHTTPTQSEGQDGTMRRQYRCPVCDKNFKLSHVLVSHYHRSHREEKVNPYMSCYVCKEKFMNPVIFKVHLRIHHDQESGKKFVCDFPDCNEEFSHSFKLLDHGRAHDEVGKNETPRKEKSSQSRGEDVGDGEVEGVKKHARTGTWLCTLCANSVIFKTPTALRVHLEQNHETSSEEKNVHCCFCHLKFLHKETYEMHVRTVHARKYAKGRANHRCDADQCHKMFASLAQLHTHLQQHLRDDLESAPSQPRTISYCHYCGWGFLNRSTLELHVLCHTEPEGNIESGFTYSCPQCASTYGSIEKLTLHFNQTHGQNIKPWKCPDCSMEFYTFGNFRRHRASVHGESTDVKYVSKRGSGDQCQFCGKKYSTLHLLQKHIKRFHDTPLKEKNPWICTDCNLSFRTQLRMTYHLNKVHQKQQYVCSECGKMFFSSGTLAMHMKYHQAVPVTCDICGKGFKDDRYLKRHKLQKHDPNTVKEWICSTCGMKFKSDSGLNYHIQSKHVPEEKKRYGCRYCPRRFYRFPLFKMHMQTCMKALGIPPDDEEALAALVRPDNPHGEPITNSSTSDNGGNKSTD